MITWYSMWSSHDTISKVTWCGLQGHVIIATQFPHDQFLSFFSCSGPFSSGWNTRGESIYSFFLLSLIHLQYLPYYLVRSSQKIVSLRSFPDQIFQFSIFFNFCACIYGYDLRVETIQGNNGIAFFFAILPNHPCFCISLCFCSCCATLGGF